MSGWTQEQLFSSEKMDWETPQALFDALDDEFSFVLDAAASEDNTKCSRFFDASSDGLVHEWAHWVDREHSVFVNPPYGRGIVEWMQKCAEEGEFCRVVALVFARTDTRWFHKWVAPWASEVRFIKGRIKFKREGVVGPAPAPSMVVVWEPDTIENTCKFKTMEQP